jgi:outer membrane lipoprotein
MWRRIGLAFALLIIGGCPSPLPNLIREAPPEDPSLEAVRGNISRYEGTYVRWGGTIAGIQNKKEFTELEIVARALDKQGRPQATDESPGRFLARVDGFLEPAIYRSGREVTIYGLVEKGMEGEIGEHPYLFPVVRVETYYLWETREIAHYYAYPHFYYHPYYFHPFGFYPFRYPFWY